MPAAVVGPPMLALEAMMASSRSNRSSRAPTKQKTMFTTTMSGFEPGQVETPEVRVDEYGVHFTVHGFSPMSVSWQEGKAGTGNLQQAGLSNSPGGASGNLAKTGDNLPIVALVIVVVVAAAGAAGVAIYRRRKAQAEPQDPSQDS